MRATWMAIVGTIAAAGCERDPVEPFADLDRNEDSRISREEARADPSIEDEFANADKNSDGELSAQEYLRAAMDER